MQKYANKSGVGKRAIILASTIESPSQLLKIEPSDHQTDSSPKSKPMELKCDDPISVMKKPSTRELKRHPTKLVVEMEAQVDQPATSSKEDRSNPPDKKHIFLSHNFCVEYRDQQRRANSDKVRDKFQNPHRRNQILKFVGNEHFVSDTRMFLCSPVPPEREYTFVLRRESDTEIKVYFDQQQEVLSCTLARKAILMEGSEGPLAALKELSKNVFSLEPEQSLVADHMICFERLCQKSKYYLNCEVYQKKESNPTSQAVSTQDVKQLTRVLKKIVSTMSPVLRNEEDSKARRFELPISPKPNMPQTLRPSQYHCIMQDEDSRECCLMIEHAGLQVLWVTDRLCPLLAIACAISRMHLIENFARKKDCLLS